ncbi:MAG: acetyltransferase [Cyclobacteriaceae bacterium]|nr:acetyltransferase [Cyclobacteriaceae bacterium]
MGIGLLGYSGHAFVVAEAALLCGHHLVGYANKVEVATNPFSLAYLGDERAKTFQGWERCTSFILGIGENKIRVKVAAYVRKRGHQCHTIIHPDASVSSYTKMGEGTFIARGATVNPLCTIGNDVIINTAASIDHECVVNNGAHVAPGAVLAGNVIIGSGAFIGANAVIKEGIIIGDNVVIGAGSVVLKNVADGEKVVGNPARRYE